MKRLFLFLTLAMLPVYAAAQSGPSGNVRTAGLLGMNPSGDLIYLLGQAGAPGPPAGNIQAIAGVALGTDGLFHYLQVDASGNLSTGAILGYTIPPLAAGCLSSAGTTGPLSWAACSGGGGSMTWPDGTASGIPNYSYPNAWNSTTPVYNAANPIPFNFLTGVQATLSLIKGTYVDGDVCTYTASGTLLNCNTAPATGTVTAVSVATANGVSGTSSGGATPALTIALGAITPSTVNGLAVSLYGTTNVVVGSGAGPGGTGGYATVLGYGVLTNSSSGLANTGMGWEALFNEVSGADNSAVGYASLYNATSSDNTAFGFNSLRGATSGGNNTGIGYAAGGSTSATYSNSTFLGASTLPSATSDTNETVVGYGVTGNGSNTVTIGNSSVTGVYFGGPLQSPSIGSGSAITSSGPGGTLTAPAYAAFGTANGTVAEGGVITAAGPTGSATAIPVITYNAAGQLTAVTTVTPTVATVQGGATNDILYQTAANTTGFITPVDNAVVTTSASGVPSESTTIPNGVTASTQSANSADNKLATDNTILNAFATPPTAGYGSTTPEPVNATTVTASGGVTSTSDGVHAGKLGLDSNTTLPTLNTGEFNLIGANSVSVTAYGWQVPTATNSSAGIMHVGAESSNVSQLSISLVSLTADVSGILPSTNGGTGVNNSATLTLGSSNQNWATLGTGIIKNTTTTGALSDAASSDVIALWSGTCNSSSYLNGAGTCTTPSGSGTTLPQLIFEPYRSGNAWGFTQGPGANGIQLFPLIATTSTQISRIIFDIQTGDATSGHYVDIGIYGPNCDSSKAGTTVPLVLDIGPTIVSAANAQSFTFVQGLTTLSAGDYCLATTGVSTTAAYSAGSQKYLSFGSGGASTSGTSTTSTGGQLPSTITLNSGTTGLLTVSYMPSGMVAY